LSLGCENTQSLTDATRFSKRPKFGTAAARRNDNDSRGAGAIRLYQGAIAMFENHPRIERYSWYPWSENCELNEEDGSLTTLGEAYAAAPAHR